ncbi:cellulose biosynthesis protein BcsS [Methylobacterium sp. PvR107]|uniref:cellulose biosynthesis protein BcsS n=1 Tax=Methylobacterium sp. PvR107 TaxID=2806597 RepID=UPI001B69620E|nr:cellulose biosynthesis protein BcsS [Methylobacterium sp. PvR107]MBP1179864.1 hypothetical protein [Methylobacterium sp. PvR107]
MRFDLTWMRKFVVCVVVFASAYGVHPLATSAGEIDTLLFGSLDASAATFLTLGAKAAWGPLNHDGFVALASLGGGVRDERGSTEARQRYTASAALVIGYQWFFDWGVIAAYAGPEGIREMLLHGRGLAELEPHFGLRLQGEIWARPTQATLVQAGVVAGSARDSVWARLAWGYRFCDTYVGPEVAAYTDATGYRKWNLGLHGTDFTMGRYSFRVSAGLQSETGRRTPGPYLALAVWSPW